MAASALTAIALAAKMANWWWAWPRGLRRQVVALEIEGSNPSAHPCARSSAERASAFGTETGRAGGCFPVPHGPVLYLAEGVIEGCCVLW